MWLFLVILLFAGTINMAIKFSLFEKTLNGCLAVIFTILAVGSMYSAAIRMNIQDVTDFMNNYDSLVNVGIIVIAESVSILLLAARLLADHSNNKKVTFSKIIVMCPSVSGIIGLYIGLVYMLNCISGWQLGLLAFVSLAGALIALLLFHLLLRFVVLSWQFRLDIVLILAFVQIVIAMFLPLIVSGRMSIANSYDHNLGRDFIFCISAMTIILVAAYFIRIFISSYVKTASQE